MKSYPEFQAFYYNTLYPLLEPLEEERKDTAMRAFIWCGAIAIVMGVLMILIMVLPVTLDDRGEWIFTVGVLGVLAMGGAYALIIRSYVSRFKEVVIQNLVGFIDSGMRYAPTDCIPASTYLESGIFKREYDRYNGDDCVQGRIGQTEFLFSELHTEYREVYYEKGRRRERWVTIFRGLFFVADFHKDFQGTTYVLPDVAERFLGGLGGIFQSNNNSHGNLIKLEDPEFERLFVVYGSDTIEAHYILSTSLMSRIVAFQQKTGRPLRIAFVNSKMFIAISHDRPLFEPNVFRSLLEIEHVSEYFDDLSLALGIVEDMNLNTRIWTKV